MTYFRICNNAHQKYGKYFCFKYFLYMKSKILLLLIVTIIFSQKTTYTQNNILFAQKTNSGQNNENKTKVNNADKIQARLIICSGLSEKRVPLDNLKDINVKEGGKVTLYVKWFNLKKKSYTTSMDFLDSAGNYLAQSSAYKFRPKKKTHNTWNSRKFRKVIIPEGNFRIRIKLDNEIILEKEVIINYKTE